MRPRGLYSALVCVFSLYPYIWYTKHFFRNKKGYGFLFYQAELVLAVVRKKTLNFKLEVLQVIDEKKII